MPLCHVTQYEAIWWQDFSHAESVSAVAALAAFMGVKTRSIQVREIGSVEHSRLV